MCIILTCYGQLLIKGTIAGSLQCLLQAGSLQCLLLAGLTVHDSIWKLRWYCSDMLLVLIWSLLYLLAPVQKTVVITPEEFNKLKTEGVLKFSQPTTTNVQRPLQVISPTISNPTIQVDNEVQFIYFYSLIGKKINVWYWVMTWYYTYTCTLDYHSHDWSLHLYHH